MGRGRWFPGAGHRLDADHAATGCPASAGAEKVLEPDVGASQDEGARIGEAQVLRDRPRLSEGDVHGDTNDGGLTRPVETLDRRCALAEL